MVCHICPVGPTALVVEGKVIHDPMPDMGIGQGTVQVEEGSFCSKGPHSLLLCVVRRKVKRVCDAPG